MAFTGEVCSACRFVLCSRPGFDLAPYTDTYGWITPPGQTFDAFRDAAANECVICSIVWNATDRHAVAWSNAAAEAWEPLQYKAEGPRAWEPLVRLDVTYSDPLKHNKHSELRFRLVPINSEECKEYFVSSHTEDSTSSETTLEMAYEWFHSCHSKHELCGRLGKLSSSTLPTRLLDVGQDDDTHYILRIVLEDNIPPASSYITLSYRWGYKPSLLLLSSNLTQLRRPNPINHLPQTFQDVITVARRLRIRYVWIDALCIMQDSTSDWETEALNMRHVYANSACNIAASACDDPEETMFRFRDPKSICPRTVYSSLFAEGPSPHYIFEKSYWDRYIYDGPLHKRGWVFQERFLAPRVLYFSKHQVMWECLSEHKCEGFPQGIPMHLSDKSVDPLLEALSGAGKGGMTILVFNLWNDLIERYSQCDLTKHSDKLFAMAGIAKLFQEVTGDEYVAGWWRSYLLESLDWQVFEPRLCQGTDYRAPSWSWASVDSPIWTARISSSMKLLVELVGVQVNTRGADPMRSIYHATLTLKGSTFTAVCHYDNASDCVLLTDRGKISTWLYPDCLDTDFPEGKKLTCILYKSEYWISQHGDTPHIVCFMTEEVGTCAPDTCYRRLGFFYLDGGEQIKKFGTGWETTEMVLV